MKKKNFHVILLLALFAALWSLSACSQTPAAPRAFSAAALRAQVVTPPPPPVEDRSEIGSTDGIFIMGVVIAAIAILPVLTYGRKK